ncbi:MAG: hypothetical protein ACQEQC_07190 [Elusimicrobiota bacterium]
MKRESKYYSEGLLKAARRFDGSDNEYALNIIKNFNRDIVKEDGFKEISLNLPSGEGIPENIVWIDASQDNLPATSEAQRVVNKGKVINTREEILKEMEKKPATTLYLSHCVKKKTYNKNLSLKIEDKGSVASPGPLTAPGGLFSNKLETYKLLLKNFPGKDLVAKFQDAGLKNRKSPEDTARNILDTVDSIDETDSFFIKPPEGGGGLGGFRLVKIPKNNGVRYIIPDLSRVSGDTARPHIIDLTVNPEKAGVLEELWWVYNYFKSHKILNKNYIKIDIQSKNDLETILKTRKNKKSYSRKEAVSKLTGAIKKFEKKFNRRYHPIVNHYINFGTWGLRAHYRLTEKGIQLETIYARIFQIKFSKNGIGYVGADNISNKQTGELELDRLVPVNNLMVNAAGGKRRIYRILKKGALGMKALIETLPPNLKDKVPVRAQFDLAPAAGLIGEANADTARGFCLAQNFDSFAKNTRRWYRDSLKYYRYRKQHYEVE